ncbi:MULTISPECIES: alpha/beta fold hydrolase [Sphingobacterium]|uniref:alpha/beta fold hydrolase n=1 Tax=Sphingobacterium TaxID=28453 RepID=UPI001969F685|nr:MULTISPECIES: alpha/beta hydrolase [unclassified Sphingobacterium]
MNTAENGNYAYINGISMYYEVYGSPTGIPLVLRHGGGSTIQTTFGRVISTLSKSRKVITVELQARGHTSDREGPISFEQDADGVATLLQYLNITKADIFGFSNGANTALLLATRHPQCCSKIIAGSPLLKRDGAFSQFWEFINNGTFEQMPQAYKDAFLAATPDPKKLMNLYEKCGERIKRLKDLPDEQFRAIA